MGKVVLKIGAAVWAQGILYFAVVQLVFLYWSDICVVTEEMPKVLESFQHWVARRITGITAHCMTGKEW